jgi:hypothetical protein
VPDSNYPLVNIVSWDARIVRTLWIGAGGVVYLAFLLFVHSRHESNGFIEAAMGFCMLALLQPFTQKYALVVLLVPAMVAGQIRWTGTPRVLLYSSIVLVLIQPLAPGSAAQRLLQVLGMDLQQRCSRSHWRFMRIL